MTDIKIKDGKVFFKDVEVPTCIEIVDFDSVIEETKIYVALKTSCGDCIVQKIDSDGNIIWSTEGKQKIYDIDTHHSKEDTYKIDFFDDAFSGACIVVYAFTYCFVLGRDKGNFLQVDYNR